MPWYSSWLPDLRNFNFAIPTGIQGRFLSFILKKSLGHFLKPGQFDHNQVDSQLGSGYVQVTDLELNCEAVNAYFDGIPIALSSGTISSIKARIPWPNPLVSTLGFSLKSLHLIFHVVPYTQRVNVPDISLSESVASAAESFIHEELSPGEEATLWQSLHPDMVQPDADADQSVPGGLDDSTTLDETVRMFDQDLAGVSVFASLIERLLSKFEFDVEDVKITLVHPGNISLTMSIRGLRYDTDGNHNLSSGQPRGETRTLAIDGFTLLSHDLGTQESFLDTTTDSPRSDPISIATSRPFSRASSGSSMDEAAQFMMSQSLAVLPSDLLSSASSVGNSLYESAISTSIVPSDQEDMAIDIPSSTVPTEFRDEIGEKFLSIETQPVLMHLTTPSPISKNYEDDLFRSPNDSDIPRDGLHLSVSIGFVSLTVRPWQVRALLRLCKVMVPQKNTSRNPFLSTESSGARLPSTKFDMKIRGIVALFLPQATEGHESSDAAPLLDFFVKPLVPPLLRTGYIRLYLDALSGSLTAIKGDHLKYGNASSALVQSLDVSVSDLSLFFFKRGAEMMDAVTAFPLLHTDLQLISQYATENLQPQFGESLSNLPSFEIIDWTDDKCKSFGARLSQWRCRPARGSHVKSHPDSHGLPSTSESDVNASSLVGRPSLRISGSRYMKVGRNEGANSETSEDVDIQIAPINIRFDFGHLLQVGGPLAFLEDLLLLETQEDSQTSISCQEAVDVSSPVSEGKHLIAESVYFDHTGYNPDILHPQKDEKDRHLHLSVNFSFIRLSLKCPPPPPETKDRSGILIVDLHDVALSSSQRPSMTARFAAGNASLARDLDLSEESTIIRFEFSRAILASTMIRESTANVFASIGTLRTERFVENSPESMNASSLRPPSLRPGIHVLRPNARSPRAPLFSFSVDLPSVYVHISKSEFDALQYLADDINQFLYRLSNSPKYMMQVGATDSRDTSIIGSRFFVKSRSGSGIASSSSPNERRESVVKLTVTRAFFKIVIPRTDSEIYEHRPLELKASNLDIVLELNPDGRQQTILNLDVMDLALVNIDAQTKSQHLLNLTSTRAMSSSAKPIVKLRVSALTVPGFDTKETQIKLTISGITYTFFPDLSLFSDLVQFSKNPPGTFESVIPSDRTRVHVKLFDVSIRLFAPNNSSSIVSYVQEMDCSTDVEDDSRDTSIHVLATALSLLAIDDFRSQEVHRDFANSAKGLSVWTAADYALLAEVTDLDMNVIRQRSDNSPWKVLISRITSRLHLCADTLTAVTSFFEDFSCLFRNSDEALMDSVKGPAVVNQRQSADGGTLMSSVEDLAFKGVPEVGAAPDMIFDDLPSNPDYLDESFGAAGGLREFRDDDLDEFEGHEVDPSSIDDPHIVSTVGGETIKVFDSQGLEAVDNYFLSLPPDTSRGVTYAGKLDLSVQVLEGSCTLLLYGGYDWVKTRKTIEEEVKEVRKRLAKIRQLVATGQLQDPAIEDTGTLLFNSVRIGLDEDEELLGEPAALIAAIDEELRDDLETASQSSWQSLRPVSSGKLRGRSIRIHGKRLERSKTPSMEFHIQGLHMEFDRYQQDDPLVSRTLIAVRNLEILDHIKTSTWKKFLTELRSDSRGNVRETDSDMVRVELQGVRPVPGHSSEETRLKAKILPLRLYVDQDAVDFLKKFFSFKDPNASVSASSPTDGEAYIQMAEIFPVNLKLDYKPRRVDYRALKEGRTIELMNFFHFDGAEMTLRHITLAGVTGWGRFFEMLNDLWTPDVKATQLVEVISGVAPIRSMVNVGSGVADLILLPINQYKKDGRIVRGVQKGATAFVKSTALEAIKLGAKLATGTQVILEQAEGVLGGQFEPQITAEPVQVPFGEEFNSDEEREDDMDSISKYAQQPANLQEGVHSAYKSLRKNFSSAAQTILAVPMEVYERSGNEGPVRSVIRAVPIAVLKPMIGTSEAVSKTLLGLHNTLDPNAHQENEAKYKLR